MPVRFRIIFSAITFLILLSVGSAARSDQNDDRLPALFDILRTAASPDHARQIEGQIWLIWSQLPEDEATAEIFQNGVSKLTQRAFAEALDAFDQVTKRAPDFAEGWNKRATVLFLMQDFERSITDVERTLALEPRHFGALSGLGLIYLNLDRPKDALLAFEQALEIHPMLPARLEIDGLREALKGQKL